jgi:hypothetical protein
MPESALTTSVAQAAARTLASALAVLTMGCTGERVDLGVIAPRPDLLGRPLLSLRAWGDGYAVVLTEYERHGESWRVASSRAVICEAPGEAFVALRLPGCAAVIDLAEAGDERLALCSEERALSVYRGSAGDPAWQREVVPLEATGTPWRSAARLAAGRAGTAVVASTHLAWQAPGATSWQQLAFTESNELGTATPPAALAITSAGLWLGYNHGEWSGSLHHAAIREGGRLASPEPVIERLNVLGIAPAKGGGVWVAGGLGHMSLNQAVLLHIEGSTLDSILAQDNVDGSLLPAGLPPPRQRLPEESNVSAFATAEGRPLLLVPDRGIYELRDGSLRLWLRGTFTGYRPAHGVLFHWSVAEFLALSGGRLVTALSSGELVEIAPGREPVRLELPAPDSRGR